MKNDDINIIDMGDAPAPQQTAVAHPDGKRSVAYQVAQQGLVTPVDLLRHALDSGADLDRLEKLMDLQQRWEANEARKAFADAMADFKLAPPDIYKDGWVSYGEGKNKTEYQHATIGNVVEKIMAAAAEHGFSHRWDLTQKDGRVIVDCVVTHRAGHEQKTTLEAAPDTSGGKNGIQSIISAKTYLQRHTLLAAFGLATKDQLDDDGAGADAANEVRQDAAQRRTEPPPLPIIGKKGLQAAIDSILAGIYARASLEKDYKLTPEQVEHVNAVLGKKEGA